MGAALAGEDSATFLLPKSEKPDFGAGFLAAGAGVGFGLGAPPKRLRVGDFFGSGLIGSGLGFGLGAPPKRLIVADRAGTFSAAGFGLGLGLDAPPKRLRVGDFLVSGLAGSGLGFGFDVPPNRLIVPSLLGTGISFLGCSAFGAGAGLPPKNEKGAEAALGAGVGSSSGSFLGAGLLKSEKAGVSFLDAGEGGGGDFFGVGFSGALKKPHKFPCLYWIILVVVCHF